MSKYVYLCRNKVYRRGITMKCGRPSVTMHCEGCEKALYEQRSKLLGLDEDKQWRPSEEPNKPDDLEIDQEFDVQDAGHETWEEKPLPGDMQVRDSSLSDGPDGAKQTGNPYLKENKEEDKPWEKKGKKKDKEKGKWDRGKKEAKSWGPEEAQANWDNTRPGCGAPCKPRRPCCKDDHMGDALKETTREPRFYSEHEGDWRRPRGKWGVESYEDMVSAANAEVDRDEEDSGKHCPTCTCDDHDIPVDDEYGGFSLHDHP